MLILLMPRAQAQDDDTSAPEISAPVTAVGAGAATDNSAPPDGSTADSGGSATATGDGSAGAADAGASPAVTAEGPTDPRTTAPDSTPVGGQAFITMNFQDVDIPVLAKFISEITGRNFVVDGCVRGKVSIISPTKVTAEQAYSIFQSVLQLKGFATVNAGPITKIVCAPSISGQFLDLVEEQRGELVIESTASTLPSSPWVTSSGKVVSRNSSPAPFRIPAKSGT